ncbi:adenylate/guanylate cyclase domain-containing protein [Winogradskyella haliclonae]|uniref:Guanylate cyclase n=1 Tax=Winogradskyella haliclonae TaxID=2048558 RepID=A0ABQ2BZQ7_9FLAO|nr:adenylate/guanylate cyclase domain-containing protein [Winogradskyella haliclonae]GGI57283.1 guanylate cyclase [Winogradskyella haliclonae]
MSNKIKSFFQLLLISSIFWVFAFVLFTAIRYNGLEEELSLFTDDILYLPVNAYYKHAIIVGLIISVFYAIIEFVFDRLSKRVVLGLSIVFKSLVYFVLIIVVLSGISFLLEEQIDRDLPNEKGWWRDDPFFWITVIYFVVASIIFSLIRVANDRFGRGNFIQVLVGKYKRPKEQEHILMFIDLKDSTKIAEKLGHQKYSQFIQDCFIDLNMSLNNYGAEVYQYVGDEAVIYWPSNRGFKNNNCINLFFAFQKRLEKKQSYYTNKYAFNPKFKAGLHFGKLMVAEIGTIKKDLAFHGDVINTASRIQSLCNTFNKSLLVSESVIEKLSVSDTHYELLSHDMELRGKEERLRIYAINQG